MNSCSRAQSYTDGLAALSFEDARALVLREISARRVPPQVETVPLEDCLGRVLAEDAVADRNYPPFNRAMRDGFAFHHEDAGNLRIVGEVRAGVEFSGSIQRGEAVEIMTGAPVPQGATAVLMVEHSLRNSDGTMTPKQKVTEGMNISPAGCEAKSGEAGISKGARITPAIAAWLATIGAAKVKVYRQMRVAIVATGDELVPVDQVPLAFQIRNSNTVALRMQVARVGAIPVALPIAKDNVEHTRELLLQAFESDMVLLSGGVSAGRYDLVEQVLADLGAIFHFDRVQIQPGAPLVFGAVNEKFFFGLPGNPGSTMATFELFARAAIELLSGSAAPSLPLTFAHLTKPLQHKGALTRFLPGEIESGQVTPLVSQGSGDVPALARANCYMIARPQRTTYQAGDSIEVITAI